MEQAFNLERIIMVMKLKLLLLVLKLPLPLRDKLILEQGWTLDKVLAPPLLSVAPLQQGYPP